jgi:arabinose-5-phosphate isomerase
MNFINIALNVLEIEASALSNLHQHIDEDFQKACEIILSCQGKLIVTGIGKSGLIGKKIAATLSSTGTPAIFLHPTEASHGDFGVLQNTDVIFALSHSGYTEELCKLLPSIQKQNIPIVSITSQKYSPLAKASQAVLTYGTPPEACPLGLAPTTSSTLALVLGDALAVALLKAKNFREEDFAQNHPGGSLGQKFIPSLQLAHTLEHLPKIQAHSNLHDCLIEVSSKKLGMTCVTNAQDKLVGVVTDGDIRRCLMRQIDIYQTQTQEIMNPSPKTISQNTLAKDALKMMKDLSITSLIIIDKDNCPIGVLHIHDLLKAGFAH